MTNKPKKQGTTFLLSLEVLFRGLGFMCRRLAEHGNADEGDAEFWVNDQRYVIEAKCVEALSAHAAYADARSKTSDPVLLAWKRHKPLTESRKRRTSAGTLWILDTPTLMRLLGRTE